MAKKGAPARTAALRERPPMTTCAPRRPRCAPTRPAAPVRAIGIDQGSGYHSATRTPGGVIHFEADEPSPFTLQQVFAMWGVDFSADRLGAYTPYAAKQIHVYVNGERVVDPASRDRERRQRPRRLRHRGLLPDRAARRRARERLAARPTTRRRDGNLST